MRLAWVRGRSRHGALGHGIGAVLAGVFVLATAPLAWAQQPPPGCSGTGVTINLSVERADGSDVGVGSVSPCETLLYKGSLTGGLTGECTTPDGVSHDVTPAGGVPEKCPAVASAHVPTRPAAAQVAERLSGLALPFVENAGQSDPRVAYYAPTFSGTVFVTRQGETVYALPGPTEPATARERAPAAPAAGRALTESFGGGSASPAA